MSRIKKRVRKVVSALLACVGIGIIWYTVSPVISYELGYSRDSEIISSRVESVSANEYDVQENIDYTKASNWFPQSDSSVFETGNVKYFTISIPTLDIKNATVAIGGDDLSNHLIQYPGTALPGKIGNTVIFGHSILPRYYDPENYISIFSKLYELESGDEIYIDYDGIVYSYLVDNSFEVLPTALEILEQDTSQSYLSLVTCTPPGHPLKPKRLIVRAKLVQK